MFRFLLTELVAGADDADCGEDARAGAEGADAGGALSSSSSVELNLASAHNSTD